MEPSVLSRSRMMGKKTVNSRRIMAAVMVIVMLAALTGCVGKEDTQTRKKNKVVEIPMILTVDSSTGNKNEEEVVERFNRAYKGKYHIDVDWVMETEEEYRKNLKRMNVTDELPAIITDLRMLPSFYQMMIKKGRIEDLTPYINEDQEWKDMIEPSVMESVREEDGKIYLGPVSTAAFACSGVFWNRELFEQAGISRFPETWEEFWECCEKLKAAGITPLALHTEGTAWAAMLLATAEVAGSEEGAAFMKQLYPDTYQNEPGLEIAGTLKKLFQYTTQDALHNDFDVAHDNFVAGNAAMIPNGYWMIDQIPEEMQKKVCFSTFPENKLIGSPETFGWAVVSTYSEKVKKGAVEFLKFRTKLNKEQKEELLNSRTRQEGTLLDDYLKAYTGNPQIVPNYQVKWNSLLQEDVLGECLAELAKEYTKETGVDVTVLTAASGEYEKTLKSEMAKSNAPTLFQVNGPVGLASWKDYCYDLKDSDVAKQLTSDDFALMDGDKMSGIAYVIESYGIIYNKELLKKAGYSADDITNFDSFKKVVEDITANKDKLGFSAFTSAGMDGSSDWRFKTHLANLPIYYEYKDEGIDNTDAIKGTYLDNYRQIWDLYINNATCKPTELSTKTADDATADFVTGDAVFYQNGTWEYNNIKDVGDDNLGILPIYIGVEGEEDQGICTGTENYWCVNSKASEDDIQATLDFMNWCVTSDDGVKAMCKDMGFTIPFKKNLKSDNVLVNEANKYTEDGKTPVSWNFSTMPSEEWKNGVGSALTSYAADPTDANWAKVTTAVVDGWAKEAAAAK